MKSDIKKRRNGERAVEQLWIAICQRLIHGQEKAASCQYVLGLSLFVVCSQIAFTADIGWADPQLAPESAILFLAPTPGAIHTFTNSDGLENQQRCISSSSDRLVIEESICCFQPPSDNEPPVTLAFPPYTTVQTPKKPWSVDSQYTLYAEQNKLMKTTELGDIALIDFERKIWTIPIFSSPGMPKKATCEIVSQKVENMWGEDRSVVKVQCKAQLDGEIVHEESWTLASGIGFIATGDFKLASIKKETDQPNSNKIKQ